MGTIVPSGTCTAAGPGRQQTRGGAGAAWALRGLGAPCLRVTASPRHRVAGTRPPGRREGDAQRRSLSNVVPPVPFLPWPWGECRPGAEGGDVTGRALPPRGSSACPVASAPREDCSQAASGRTLTPDVPSSARIWIPGLRTAIRDFFSAKRGPAQSLSSLASSTALR